MMFRGVDYMLLQWEAIKGIFTERYYYLDNNLVERYNRYISLSRRNSLFFGSHKGGGKRCIILFAGLFMQNAGNKYLRIYHGGNQ